MDKIDGDSGVPPDQNPEHHEGGEHLHRVRIHIDLEPYETVTPTTGTALYELAGLGPPPRTFQGGERG